MRQTPERADEPVPVDLVTNSGSGLDPHISPDAAEYQVPRIADNNDMSEDEVRAIIKNAQRVRFSAYLERRQSTC